MSSRIVLTFIGGLVVGIVIGPWVAEKLSNDVAGQLGYCIDPTKVAETTVLALRRQNKITVFSTEIRARSPAIERRWLVDAHKTLTATGTVNYHIDFNGVSLAAVKWNDAAKTLTLKIPNPVASQPVIDLSRIVEEKDGYLIMWYTGAEKKLDADTRRNLQGAIWRRAKSDKRLLAEAKSAAALAVKRDFELPLQALGIPAAKVIVEFPESI